MSTRALSLAVVSVLLAFSPASAELLPRKTPEAPDAPAAPAVPEKKIDAAEVAKLLEQLAKIQEGLAGKRTSYNASLLPRLKEAAASNDKAFDLWLESVKDIDYEQNGRSATDFSDFRNGRAKKMRTSEFGLSLQFQIRFLIILIQASEAETDSKKREVISATTAYLDDMTSSVKKLGNERDKLNQNVLDGVIARHLKLDVSIKRSEGMSGNPGEIEQIYEKMILPFYRAQRAATQLSAAWQKRISQEMAIVREDKNAEAMAKFQSERLPALKWGAALDQYGAGQQQPAVNAMLALIKENLGHRYADRWITDLTNLLKKPDAPAFPADPAPKPESE